VRLLHVRETMPSHRGVPLGSAAAVSEVGRGAQSNLSPLAQMKIKHLLHAVLKKNQE
jgi:hypothetical protein